jgi:hypothetical protein
VTKLSVSLCVFIPLQYGCWVKNINEDGAYFDLQGFGTTPWPASIIEIDIMEHGIFPSKPQDFIQSALHTPSSSGNTVNHGGILASDLQNNYIYIYELVTYKISFLLDGVIFYTYDPAVKRRSNMAFDKEQYFLYVAMGGIAGAIPSSFTQASMDIDYVRVYQNTLIDTEGPTNLQLSGRLLVLQWVISKCKG